MHKTIVDLRPGDCRWPLGLSADGDRMFCCHEALEGRAYCPRHGRESVESRIYRPRPARAEPEFPHPRMHSTQEEGRNYWRNPHGMSEREPDLVELIGEVA